MQADCRYAGDFSGQCALSGDESPTRTVHRCTAAQQISRHTCEISYSSQPYLVLHMSGHIHQAERQGPSQRSSGLEAV